MAVNLVGMVSLTDWHSQKRPREQRSARCPAIPLGQVQEPDLQTGDRNRIQNSLFCKVFCRVPAVTMVGVHNDQLEPMDQGITVVLQNPGTFPKQV